MHSFKVDQYEAFFSILAFKSRAVGFHFSGTFHALFFYFSWNFPSLAVSFRLSYFPECAPALRQRHSVICGDLLFQDAL